jgi:hypothetical protein
MDEKLKEKVRKNKKDNESRFIMFDNDIEIKEANNEDNRKE